MQPWTVMACHQTAKAVQFETDGTQMPWRQRGQRRYYYRTIQTDGRPRSVYVGTGEVGEAAAAEDEARRAERRRQRELLKAQQQQITTNLSAVVELNERMESLTRAALLGAGFHQHARSQWRKRHHAK